MLNIHSKLQILKINQIYCLTIKNINGRKEKINFKKKGLGKLNLIDSNNYKTIRKI